MQIITPSRTDSLQEGNFSLIHIPLPLYPLLIQPIIRALLPNGGRSYGNAPEGPLDGLSADNTHEFLNISVTPIECSIVCHVSWARSVFEPAIERLPQELACQVQISKDTYNVFSVNSGEMVGQRVIDLTAPLAMEGVPIFFITTYYTDYILVPSQDRIRVNHALLAQGFEFSYDDSKYVEPFSSSHSRISSASSGPPPTPPPSDIAELQRRTFAQLKKRNVVPMVKADLLLVQCTGNEASQDQTMSNGRGTLHEDGRPSWLDRIDTKVYTGLVSALVNEPKFISVTLTQDEPPSLLLDKALVPLFGDSIQGTNVELVPIFLDLVDLPLESTGIVCGVASKLVNEMHMQVTAQGTELSYLSTARAGAVILPAEGCAKALETLEPLLEPDDVDDAGE